jgi:hypothetical protein
MRFFLFLVLIISIENKVNAQEVQTHQIRLASGCQYFRNSPSSPYPLIAQAISIGHIYCSAGLADSLLTVAFKDGQPFSGVAIHTDSTGTTLGKYAFVNGLITKMEEFKPSGDVLIDLNFEQGFAHGVNKAYYPNGRLRYLYTYCHGNKDGPFVHSVDRTDLQLPPCYNQGNAINGTLIYDVECN